ncbi:MAG: 16S rRNA (cytosine(967)-C(5))-methyltransferase [Nitrosomonadaceae bacterium]|nr:16S rRNA (cytosine(967)-C(5))-methyltransferase [Nitrosomonadaceae bacterium]|tara:strand:- start:21624 stop:22901 length:1278 start_codon:yes stop_codon:yes gene_type:complete
MITTQIIATAAIEKVLAGASLTIVLNELWHTHHTLSDQERGAIQDISYGVLRFYGKLDTILSLLLKKPLKKQDVRCLLLVGLYQLQYSKVTSYTVVNHAVSASLNLKYGQGMKSLINAVLREFIREKETLLETAKDKGLGQYSHPKWWIDKLREQYPRDYSSILNTGNQRPPMTLRVNQNKIAALDYLTLLNEHDLNAQIVWDNALILKQPVSVNSLPEFATGMVSVQDAGAQLAAPFLDVHKGMHVLDACSAPGGKSAHLLELANINLTALDNNPARLALVKQNFTRLALKKYHIICGDASNLSTWWNGKLFDRILADVPCSASGVVRRHPDIKWLRRPNDLIQFASIQQKILTTLWQTLARGGKLLYVTCSVFYEENKLQIEEFLLHHSDARIIPLPTVETLDGQLLPSSQHDGFFYTLLQKI